MTDIIRRHPLTCFYGLALVIAAVALLPVRLLPGLLQRYLAWSAETGAYATVAEPWRFAFATGHWSFLSVSVFAAAPTLAALAVIALSRGTFPPGDWLDRLRPWRGGVAAGRALAVYAFLAIAVAAGALLLLSLVEEPALRERLALRYGEGAAEVAARSVLYALTDLGGLSEQPGWQGFVLPLLLVRGWSRLRAALLIGLLWAGWHLPRDLMLAFDPSDIRGFLGREALFALKCLCLAVIITCVCAAAGGVVWPGVLVHGSVNLWSAAGAAALGARWDLAYLGFLLAAAVVAAVFLTRLDRSLAAKGVI